MAKSILKNDHECFVCGNPYRPEKHHIYGGGNRSVSENEGFWVYLCARHHTRTIYSVHGDPDHRLDKELILYLEDMFDGDENLPNVNKMVTSLDEINHGLKIFSDQKLLYHRKKQRNDLHSLWDCEEKARQLVLHLEILSALPFPGVLNLYNRERLERNGAKIRDQRIPAEPSELDVVTNFHVSQVLDLRRELINGLREN